MPEKRRRSAAEVQKHIDKLYEKLSALQDELTEKKEARYTIIGESLAWAFEDCAEIDLINAARPVINNFVTYLYRIYQRDLYRRRNTASVEQEPDAWMDDGDNGGADAT